MRGPATAEGRARGEWLARHELGRGSDLGLGPHLQARVELRGPHYGKGPKGYRRSDERVRDDVCDRICLQGWIDASDVEVRVDAGVVTLSGSVLDRHDKRTLERLVESVYGVDDVRNELRLQRVGPPDLGGANASAAKRPATQTGLKSAGSH